MLRHKVQNSITSNDHIQSTATLSAVRDLRRTVLQVRNIRRIGDGKRQGVAAAISIGNDTHDIWYRVSSGPVSVSADIFFAATLIPAMKAGSKLVLPSAVSQKLTKGTQTIQEIMHLWNDDFEKIPVEAEERAMDSGQQVRGVGCFFSGGVDSLYSFLKHADEVTALIFVHGFDIRLENAQLRENVSERVRATARKLGKPLIEVETNLREFSNQHVLWGDHYFGSALASVALALSPQFSKVYIASGASYRDLHPWGSHPLIDPRWSTEETEIVLDGCGVTRIEKIARVAQNAAALHAVRVCWENRGGAHNCGYCEKCLRTMASLRALGLLERCKAFDRTLDLSRLSRIRASDQIARRYITENLEVVESSGRDPALARALRDALNGLYYRGVVGWPRRGVNWLGRSIGSKRYV